MAEANVRLRVDGRDAVNQLNRVNKAAGTLQGTVGKLVGAFAGIQAAKFVFFKTAELETQTRSLKVLTGSLGNAQKIIKELQQFGAVTPFTSSELIETAKRLKAFGFETEKIVDVTKRLGDIAGATGADLGGIATAFGQIQAKGRLQGEELLQLQERGVDLQGTLRKEYGLTAEEFQKALSKGQIGADAVSFALEKLTEKGGKYADGAIAQSDTLNGKFSTLTDNIDGVARTIGEVLTPALKDAFDIAIRLTTAINQALAARSITDRDKQGFRAQAEAEVRRFAGPFPGGPFGAGEVVVRANGKTYKGSASSVVSQITNDLINKEVQRRAGSEALATSTANAATAVATRPELGGGTAPGGGTASKRVDASKEVLALNQQLFGSTEQLSELEKILLEFQLQKQEILDRNLLPREEEIALLQAQAGFESDLIGFRKQQIKLQDEAAKKSADAIKAMEEAEQRRLEADPGFQMQQQLEKLLDVQNQVAAGATVIGNAFSNSFRAVITGSKSAQEALADMMSAVAEHFMDMAAKIIAQQIAMILYGTIMKALGVSMPGGDMGQKMSNTQYFNPTTGLGVAGPNFGLAEGGYVSGPTNALVGEGGEPEYVIPESKMRESMARYSRGARGGSVIPENGGSGTSGEGGGAAVAAPIDVRYTVERINSVDYVTADQFQTGMRQAANQGAKQGEQQTLKRLQMSSSTRKRIGM
jgi:tape measure domain-containing protein